MERLTFEGEFCGRNCSQHKVWEQLKAYEDTGLTPEEVGELIKDWSTQCTIIGECGGIERVRELAEAEKDGRLFLLPLEPRRPMLCHEYFERPWVMKNVTLCVQYQSSCGIIYYMGYDVFRDLVERGRITPLSPEGKEILKGVPT